MTNLAFAKKFSKLSLDDKMKVAKNIDTTLASDKTPKGVPMNDTERKVLKRLSSWATMNIFIGNELCPPENVLN